VIRLGGHALGFSLPPRFRVWTVGRRARLIGGHGSLLTGCYGKSSYGVLVTLRRAHPSRPSPSAYILMSPYERQTSGAQLWRCREMGAGTRRRKDTAAISNARLSLQRGIIFSCWRKRSQGDAAKPARLGSKKEDLRSKVLLGRGCYHRPTVQSFVGLPDDTPPAWPGPWQPVAVAGCRTEAQRLSGNDGRIGSDRGYGNASAAW